MATVTVYQIVVHCSNGEEYYSEEMQLDEEGLDKIHGWLMNPQTLDCLHFETQDGSHLYIPQALLLNSPTELIRREVDDGSDLASLFASIFTKSPPDAGTETKTE